MKNLFVVTRVRGSAWDAKQPMNLQEQWDEHATFMDELATNRFVVLGGPVGDETKMVLVVDAADENEIRSTLACDPWSQADILELKTIERWTVLLQAGPEDEPFVLRLLPSPVETRAQADGKRGSSRP